MKKLVYLKNVTTLKLYESKCNGCSMCIRVCPHDVFEISNGKAKIKNIDFCMECGACAKNCEKQAIYVKSGVGCASGILNGILRGTEPSCDCTKGSACC
jgi:NAD-dependent dihydropyrimidine dehydrogenase PreA subunit